MKSAKLSSQYQFVTPATAERWLSEYQYEFQRRLTLPMVDKWVNVIQRGDFMQDKEIKVVLYNQHRYLVNGQHRLNAIVKSGVGQCFNITTVTVDTSEELAEVYNTEDMNKPRSFDDVVRTRRIDELTGLTRSQLIKVSPCVSYIASGFVRKNDKRGDHHYIANEIVKTYALPADAYFDAINDGASNKFNHLSRTAVLSVGIVTFWQSSKRIPGGEQTVIDFWKGLAADDGLRRGDPRKVALEHILTTQMPAGTGNKPDKDTVSPEYQSRYVANCFNKWVEGKTFSDVRKPSTSIYNPFAPIKIIGTNFTG